MFETVRRYWYASADAAATTEKLHDCTVEIARLRAIIAQYENKSTTTTQPLKDIEITVASLM